MVMNQSKGTRLEPDPSGLIFIVDDNALLVEYAGAVLQSKGYDVQFFTDPKDVLTAMEVADPKPVALVTDYDMVEMNGWDLLASSHNIHPSLQTVLLSGSIDSSFVATHPSKLN